MSAGEAATGFLRQRYKALSQVPGVGVQREIDGVWIPADQRNVDWQAYQAWLARGNTTDAADPAPTPLTTQQVATALINGTDPVSVTLRGLIIVLAQKFGITNATAITAS